MILKPSLTKTYLVALFALLLAGAASFCIGCWRAIHASYELDYGEGAVLWQAQRVTNLTQAYHRIEQTPYMVFHYTPLYHVVARVFAIQTQDLLAAGRLVSFVSALAVGAVLTFFVWYSLPHRFPLFHRIGVSATCGVLSLNLPTMAWAKLMRVDLLALLFTFAGLLLFLVAPRVRSLDYIAFLFFGLAFFTKQTEIAAPAACLVIAFAVDRSRAFRLGAFLILLLGVGLGWLVVATHGDVLRNLVLYNVNPFSTINMLGIVQLNVSASTPLAAIALAIPIVTFLRIKRLPYAARFRTVRYWLVATQSRRGITVGSLHMLIALAVSFTSGKRGSNYNYFLEWNLACGVLFCLTLAWLLSKRRATSSDIAVLVLALILGTNGVAALAQELRPTAPPLQAENSRQVGEFLRGIDGPVYSEDLTILIVSGKEAFAEPSIITNLAQRGGWDQSQFVDRIKSGFFKAIIVTTSLDNPNRYTTEVQSAIQDEYTLDHNYGNYKIYVAKSARGANGGTSP